MIFRYVLHGCPTLVRPFDNFRNENRDPERDGLGRKRKAT